MRGKETSHPCAQPRGAYAGDPPRQLKSDPAELEMM